ncbi:FkbM family methyltransferase [Flammeovirgaceae bacterium SG7u.111]|nr:FkbM family methyltransferase [Flammeovirgaceae bacterium SG7u.132]WPO34563.1 FkbM family methyltransferase [Flammeovirgaceae bacterium SG7u.111]
MNQIKLYFWELFYLKFTAHLAELASGSQYLLRGLRKINLPEKFKSRIVAHLGDTFDSVKPFIAEVDSVKFEIDLNDDVQRGIYFNAFEKKELQLIKKIIPENAVCLDVGANIGFYTLNISKFRPKSTIHTFEPDPAVYAKLQRNCQINSVDNRVIHHPIALSDQISQQQFYRSDEAHYGCGSLSFQPQYSAETIEIETCTLDHFLDEHAIDQVDFIKIDIEGHELQMLKGAKKTLENKKVKYILVEFNGEKLKANGDTLESFLSFFESVQYAPTLFNLKLLEKLKAGKINPERICTNFLFTY